MAVSLGDTLRVTVRYVVAGARIISNHYFTQYIGLGVITDAQAVDKLSDWITDIHGQIEDIMDTSTAMSVSQVDEVQVVGVYDPLPNLNTAKVETVRTLGTFTPGFTPALAGDQYATQIAVVAVGHTALPGVRGRKSFGGLAEGTVAEAVLQGSGLTKLAAATVEWLGGPSLHDVGTEWLAGVMSLREGEFVPFNNTGAVTNILGNQVRRKLRRS